MAEGAPLARSDLAPAPASSSMFAVALVVAVTVPGAGFWSLLALLLRVPVEWLPRRRTGH